MLCTSCRRTLLRLPLRNNHPLSPISRLSLTPLTPASSSVNSTSTATSQSSNMSRARALSTSASRLYASASSASTANTTTASSSSSTDDAAAAMSPAEATIAGLVTTHLPDAAVFVQDISGGCGTMYAIDVTSGAFKGQSVLKQQRMVNSALGDVVKTWHGVQLRTRVAEDA